MEGSEVIEPSFWAGTGSLVLTPPRLAEEGAEIHKLLSGKGRVVFASSGSGGAPKWVSFHREALLASAEAVNRHLEVEASDTWMLALPVYHVGGFGVAARAYAARCGFEQFAGRWEARRFVEQLEAATATLTSLVPTQVHDLVRGGHRPPASLRAVVVGGARLDEGEGKKARELGWAVLQSYGMTETASQVATVPLAELDGPFRAMPLSILPIWEHRIGGDGCLQVRGEALFEEYLRPEDGKLQQERPFDGEGWFTTTDLAAISDGGLVVLGRADRQVKILGELVDVGTIEAALRERLPVEVGVHVLPVPDQRRGWRLIPVIEKGESGMEDKVAVLNGQLPGYAQLEAPRLVRKLPRTALGKIDAELLRREIAPGES